MTDGRPYKKNQIELKVVVQITEQLLYNKRRGSMDNALMEIRPGENKMMR